MAGIDLSKLSIPKTDEPIRRKHIVRLDELSIAYSNPEVKKGKLTKPNPLEQADKKLEKIEKKTEALLDKAQKIKLKSEERDLLNAKAVEELKPNSNQTEPDTQSNTNQPQTLQQNEPLASYFDYISMSKRKLPKQVLDYVKSKHFVYENEDYAFIDTYELIELTKKSAHQLSNAISRLENRGWFQIIKSSSAGHRTVKIDKALFGIH